MSGERAHAAGRVAAVGPFDLDHVRSVVGQQLGAVGAGDVLGQIDDLNVFQGGVVHSVHAEKQVEGQIQVCQNLAMP